MDCLIFERWAKQRCNIPQSEHATSIPVAVSSQPAPTFRRVESVMARLTELITACRNRESTKRLHLIESIMQRWEDGTEVHLADTAEQEMDDVPNGFSNDDSDNIEATQDNNGDISSETEQGPGDVLQDMIVDEIDNNDISTTEGCN